MEECIVYKESGGRSYSVVTQKSLETIQSFCHDWTKVGENLDILNRVKNLVYFDDTKYNDHKKCYQSTCHKGNLARVQNMKMT